MHPKEHAAEVKKLATAVLRNSGLKVNEKKSRKKEGIVADRSAFVISSSAVDAAVCLAQAYKVTENALAGKYADLAESLHLSLHGEMLGFLERYGGKLAGCRDG